MSDTDARLVLARADGWPRQTGLVLLLLSIPAEICALLMLAPSGVVACLGLVMALAVTLICCRRGVTLDRDSQTLSRWYGLGFAGRTLALRELEIRSLEPYKKVVVETTEHYKPWSKMFCVSLKAMDGLQRLVVDDEFRRPREAQLKAQLVARFLALT